MLRKAWGALALCLAMTLPGVVPESGLAAEEGEAPGRALAIQATRAKPEVRTMTADHGRFKQLQFDPERQKTMRPEEVTATCLGCHNLAALQFHKTIHWTWRDTEGQPRNFGKGALSVNNF